MVDLLFVSLLLGFPSGSEVKNLPANAGNLGLICGSGRSPDLGPLTTPWVRRKKWQSTLVFLPEKSHGQRSLMGYSHKRVRHNLVIKQYHHHHHPCFANDKNEA